MKIHQIEALDDNYVYILKEGQKVAVIDPSTFEDVDSFLSERGWGLDFILNTHHHFDHVGGNRELKKKYKSQVIGSFYDKERIPEIDKALLQEDVFFFSEKTKARILFIPGHTSGHIAYWFEKEKALFCGDTLFSLGCGRLFEGTPAQMWESLNKIMKLPEETFIYCGHEYTLRNAPFALELELQNEDLRKRVQNAKKLRKKGLPTVPNQLSDELKTNPFLRPDSRFLREKLKMEKESTLAVFTKIRRLRDQY